MSFTLSIIIPAYNEEYRLNDTLVKIFEYLETANFKSEVIVVDDGSKDKTTDVAKSFDNVRVITQAKNMGKGAAVRIGMLSATGDYRIFTDADLSTPIYEIPKILTPLQNGFDVCVGSRAIDSSLIKVHQPFYREFMGKTFNKIVQLLVVKGIQDTQCGFKGFSANAANAVFSKAKINGFSFDVEILYISRMLDLNIKETPVEWYNDERSKVDPIKDSAKMFIEILKIRNLHK